MMRSVRDTVLPALLAAVGGLAFARAVTPATLAAGLLTGLVAGVLAGGLLAVPRRGTIGAVLRAAAAVAILVGGVVVAAASTEAPRDVPQLVWTFLSIGLPADGLDHLAVVPYAVVAAAVLAATAAAWRGHRLLAVLAACGGLLLAALLVVPVGVPWWVAAAFAAVLAASLAAQSRARFAHPLPLAGAAPPRRRRRWWWWRPVLFGAPALGVGLAAAQLPTPEPFDVREHVAVDVVALPDENPLAVAARLSHEPPPSAAGTHVTVTVTGPDPGRLRLAVLGAYEEEGWNQQASFAITGTHLARTVVQPERSGERAGVLIEAGAATSGLLALPTAGTPVAVTDATGLRYDAAAGLLLAVPGDDGAGRATVDYATIPTPPMLDREPAAPAGLDRILYECPDSEVVAELASVLTAGIGSPRGRLRAIESWLKLRRIYVPEAPGGQTLGSVERFLEREFASGNLEVFVTSFALLARCADVPVRAVVGYPAPGADTTTSLSPSELTAWVELPVAGVGWVAIDPIPNAQERERQAELAAVPPPPAPHEQETTAAAEAQPEPATVDPQSVGGTDWLRIVVIVAVVVAAAAVALYVLAALLRVMTVRRRARVADPAFATVLAWTTVIERFHDNRLPLGPHLTATETAYATAGRVPAEVTRMLGELAAIVDRARYDGDRSTVDDAGLAWALTDAMLVRLPRGWAVRTMPLRQPRRAWSRWRLGRWLPRRRRRWTGEIPASSVLVDPAGSPDIDGYTIEARVGGGPAATVYRSRHAPTGRMVAIKVFAGAVDEQRFVWEAHVAERVSGEPGLPDVVGSGFTATGDPYLATKYYQNGTLARRVAVGGPLAPAEALAVGRRLAAALAALHGHGIVHGDVRPENVYIDDDESAVLGDVGSAWARPTSGRGGTEPAYAAPEVWRDGSPTVPSDLYSLGVTLLFAVTGREPPIGRPLDGDEVVAIFGSDVVMPLLEVDPRRRPRTARDACDMLDRLAASRSGSPLPPPAVTVRPPNP